MSTVHASPSGGQPLPLPSPLLASAVAVPEGSPPQLAIRSDAAVLLSISEMGDRDLTGRTLWTAVVLTPEEAAFVHARAINTEQDTASKLIAQIPKKSGSTDS